MTTKEMFSKLYEIREEAISHILDIVGNNTYKFKYATNVAIEDDEGSYYKEIGYAKVDEKTGMHYFAENKNDTYDEGYTFGVMSTETIVNLLSDIQFNI